MKKLAYRYRINKFRHFLNGLLFAAITIAALILCVAGISDSAASKSDIILPFMIAIISLVLGFRAMFNQNDIPEGKNVNNL